jgi:chromosomal replication initiator protein
MHDFWQTAATQLEQEMTPQQFKTWIKPLVPTAFDPETRTLHIAAPNRFKLDWVKSQFSRRIHQLAEHYWKEPIHVQFVLKNKKTIKPNDNPYEISEIDAFERQGNLLNDAFNAQLNQPIPPNSLAENTARTHEYRIAAGQNTHTSVTEPEQAKINPRLTFETFVTGKANQLARAAAIHVATQEKSSYNPLFLYGGVGLGKTHLIHAIGNQILRLRPHTKIRYIHAEQYVSDVVKAYTRKNFSEFKKYYHGLDVLIIDDIQFFSGKNRTQEEFFYAFEALLSRQAQVIITADTYPKNLDGIDERLVSRFDSGLTVAIDPPELDMRVAVLLKKAKNESVSLPKDVAVFVAKHLHSNMRELEGALRKILAFAEFHHHSITLDVAHEALKDLIKIQNQIVSIEHIQKIVSDYYGISLRDMSSKKRPANIAKPRQVAMYLAKEMTRKSLLEIGHLFGGRDHTTVLHAIRKIGGERHQDHQLDYDIQALEKNLKT